MKTRTFSSSQFNSNGTDALTIEELASIPIDIVYQWIKQGKVNKKGLTKWVDAVAKMKAKEEYTLGYADACLEMDNDSLPGAC